MLYFIVNKSSRTGKAASIWEQIEAMLLSKGVEYKAYTTEYTGHATELATMISNREDDNIGLVVLGGDGTMNEVINGITDFEKLRFGMIPTGSGNDFGRGHGFSKDPLVNLNRIISHYEKGKECYRRVDLGKVSWNSSDKARYFGISSGFGMDAMVCEEVEVSKLKKILNTLHIGKLTYGLVTVYTLFSMKTTSADVTFEYDKNNIPMSYVPPKKLHMDKLIFSAAMNLRAEGGGVPMAPAQVGTSNNLMLCSAYGIPKWRTFFCLPILMAAKHEKLKGFDLYSFEKAHIRLTEPMSLHCDGECLGPASSIEYSCEKNILKILN